MSSNDRLLQILNLNIHSYYIIPLTCKYVSLKIKSDYKNRVVETGKKLTISLS